MFIKWILGPYGGDTTPRIPLVFVKWILSHPGQWGDPPSFLAGQPKHAPRAPPSPSPTPGQKVVYYDGKT